MTSRNMAAVIAATICMLLIPGIASAELQTMDDSELSAIYAEGFSNFTIEDLGGGLTQTNAWFNIYADTYTTIDSLKMGYHDEYNYKDPIPSSFGWDEDWTGIQIGGNLNNPDEDLHAEGFFMKAVFENIDDPANRVLKSITFGADQVSGPITATFNSFSGTIDDSNDNTPEYNGHGMDLGYRTITADPNGDGSGSSFAFSLSLDGANKGYWVDFTKAVVSP